MTEPRKYILMLSCSEECSLRALFAEKVKTEQEFVARSENNPLFDRRLLPIVEHAKEQSALYNKVYEALRSADDEQI